MTSSFTTSGAAITKKDNQFTVTFQLPDEEHKLKRVFISGGITGIDNYLEKFAEAEEMLKKQTDEYSAVINPAKVMAELPELDYEDYIDISLSMLKTCDVIYMLEGWGKSQGAFAEYAYARAKKIEVLYE